MKLRMFAFAGLGAAAALGLSPAGIAATGPLPAAAIVAGPGAFAATFATPVVVITAGTAVTFVNADTVVAHSVVAVDGGANPLFRSDVIDSPGTAPVDGTAALAAGSYNFFCSVHPSMTGLLVVV